MTYDERVEQTHESSSSEFPTCKNCGRVCTEEPNRVLLCDSCRENFIKYPIPRNIVLALVITICLVVLIMVFRFPVALKAGILYEKAQEAMENKQYLTAGDYLEKAYEIYPNSPDIMGNLTVCHYYNIDVGGVMKLLDDMYVKGTEFKEGILFNKLMSISNEYNLVYYLPEDFSQEYEKIYMMSIADQKVELLKYLEKYPENLFIKMQIADILFDEEKYDECEIILNEVLNVVPDYVIGQMFLVATYREKGDFQLAEQIALSALEDNDQSAYVLATLARLELKRFEDKKALEYMTKALSLKPDDLPTLLESARAYYYNNMRNELDIVMNKIDSHYNYDSYEDKVIELKDIISGKTQWR